jgi:hypothetical protein
MITELKRDADSALHVEVIANDGEAAVLRDEQGVVYQ